MASTLPLTRSGAAAGSNTNTTKNGVGVSGRRLSRLIIAASIVSLVVSLSAVALNPRRFHIHPIPYISDAGMFDPERIVLSTGLSFSASVFLPFSLGLYSYYISRCGSRKVSRIIIAARCALINGVLLSISLIAFACTPGWYLAHHFLAALFAVTSAAWCLCVARVRYLLKRPYKLVYALGLLQAAIVLLFALVWGSVITGWPWPMIPNKDFRFVILAVMEYIGTSAFLLVVHRVGSNELANCDILIFASVSSHSPSAIPPPQKY